MVETQEHEAIDKGMLSLRVIWGAMLGSLLIYVVMCHLPGLGFKSTAGSDLPLGLLRNIFFVLGAGALITAYYIRRVILSARTDRRKPKLTERMVRSNTPPFVATYSTVVTVSLACSESIGIYGLVLFLLGDTFQTLYMFMIVSALAMVFYRPKREELVKLAMAYRKRDGSIPER